MHLFNRFKKLGTIFIVIFLLFSLTKNLLDYQKKFAFFSEYKKEFDLEAEKNKQLKSEIIKNQDYYTVEKNIREKLNLLKPDEIAVILPKISLKPTSIPTPTSQIYQQWLDLVW